MKKYLLVLLTLSLSNISNANQDYLKEDFSQNSVTVVSVSENFANQVKEETQRTELKMDNFLSRVCLNEITIFCSSTTDSNYDCLKNNFNLITGTCKNVLQEEFKKGISNNRLSIHDLKLTKDTKLLENKESVNYVLSTYKTPNVFDYRGIRFRKGFLQVRNYRYDDYEGQFVIYSAKPQNIFTDSSGIKYNPFFQKGPFFFDSKGNVKIGTLAKDWEYKPHIVFRKGSVIAFNNERELLKGILKKSVRVGKCAFLSGMEISDKEMNRCLNK